MSFTQYTPAPSLQIRCEEFTTEYEDIPAGDDAILSVDLTAISGYTPIGIIRVLTAGLLIEAFYISYTSYNDKYTAYVRLANRSTSSTSHNASATITVLYAKNY